MLPETSGEAGLPILAVMPLVTRDPTAEAAVEGLHEDICGALSRFRTLRVISPHSANCVAGLPDVDVGHKLGATHLWRGRLRTDGTTLRLGASLVLCADSTQVWDERIDIPVDEIPRLQDEIVGRIASTLVAKLEEHALAGAYRRPPAALAAHELTVRGLSKLREGTVAADDAARELFERALSVDPRFARAHVGLALSWFNEWSCQFWDRSHEANRHAYRHAHDALELDDRDAMIHVVIAKVQLYQGAFERAAWYIDRALALCPNDADLLIQIAMYEVYLGRTDSAVRHFNRAMALNPYHPNYYYAVGSIAYLFARDLEEALRLRERQDAHIYVDGPCFAAAAYAHAGRMEEARAELEQFHASYREKVTYGAPFAPGDPVRWALEVNPFRNEKDRQYFLDGLRLVGEETFASPIQASAKLSGLLARDTDGWIAEFDGTRVRLPDLKGLRDIRRLVEQAERDVHCLDLAERTEASFGSDAVLDEKGRSLVKARIRDLSEEIDDAEAMNDRARSERAKAEYDHLVESLSAALGLGGRSRRMGDLAERARTTVTWRVRHAVSKVARLHPSLGRHLDNSIRTGTFCVYKPEQPVAWDLTEPR